MAEGSRGCEGKQRLAHHGSVKRMVRIGVFDHGWWRPACDALSLDSFLLPVARPPGGNAYAADLNLRISHGTGIAEILSSQPADLLVDNGGAGLSFFRAGGDRMELVHERARKILCSHFIDPLVTAFQGLDWGVVWQCLQSPLWVKAVWDRAQAAELQRFGVANVLHLPMAAPDRDYDTQPPNPARCRYPVSFVGGQNTNYFSPQVTVATHHLLAGTLAHAVRSDLPQLNFLDVYGDLYGLGSLPDPSDDPPTRAVKTLAYFQAKLFYNAALCIRNRNRFVLFLKRKLGDVFRLIGNGWDTSYGLKTEPQLPTPEAYFQHFRETAINLNLVNGNGETGLNMRHFEITAAGGFLLCYHQPELDELFEVRKECAVFHDESELLEKIHYYLNHDDERREIAIAGQRRTLGEHLYSHRMTRLLEMLEQHGVLPRRGAAAAAPSSQPSLNLLRSPGEPLAPTAAVS
jgi:hypothetical protein